MNKALWLIITLPLASISSSVFADGCDENIQPAKVSAVYPSADTLPENLLRFYIYFDTPMRTENPLRYIYLTDNTGNRMDEVFLNNRYALWSPDRTRLTLLFDPGRVKTGLVAHNSMGRAIKANSTYNLIVNAGAINNAPCQTTYKKTFKVIEANFQKPTVANWEINQPKLETKEPLTIHFTNTIDHTSLAYRIRVRNGKDEVIAGSIDIGNQEKTWSFTPQNDWSDTDTYSLFVDQVFEDVSGNRLTGLFDQPSLLEESAKAEKYATVRITLSK